MDWQKQFSFKLTLPVAVHLHACIGSFAYQISKDCNAVHCLVMCNLAKTAVGYINLSKWQWCNRCGSIKSNSVKMFQMLQYKSNWKIMEIMTLIQPYQKCHSNVCNCFQVNEIAYSRCNSCLPTKQSDLPWHHHSHTWKCKSWSYCFHPAIYRLWTQSLRGPLRGGGRGADAPPPNV